MSERIVPYLGFNFIVALQTGGGNDVMAGFSDVSGLQTEITVAEYRSGNFAENHVMKLPSVYKSGDVTLKRGLMRNTDCYQWLEAIRTTGWAAKRQSIVITLQDETHTGVLAWTLRSVMPLKMTGPTLAAKGGADVTMEEIVLSVERVEFGLV